MEAGNYLAILQESLEKKKKVLERIVEKNAEQRQIFLADEIDAEAFDANLEEKGELIEELNRLDKGFEQVFDRVKEQMSQDRKKHAAQIKRIQQLITEVMEKSAQVQVQEQRNKELAEQKFSEARSKIRQMQAGRQAVNQYYKSMNQMNYVDPQFMDRKK